MTNKNIAIRVSHISKQYKLGGPQEPYHTLRDAIVNSLKAPIKIFRKSPPVKGFWALKDVSFDVEPGEVVGIIGRNGAGKSTLLKILSRITSPTEGTVELHGRVGSLLEVGTGFHPELTGRENIYLSGSILGMKRREIDAKLDEIVKFSEIEKFLDTPVKRYSSGMYVRLAFAVAAHLEPEILLVDEVLAVGDIEFQKKCLGKMEKVSQSGRTVLFVSHNMSAIEKICDRGILLEGGVIHSNGETKGVIDTYVKSLSKTALPLKVKNVKFGSISIHNLNGENKLTLGSWSQCVVQATFFTPVALSGCYVNLHIDDLLSRACIHLRTDYDGLYPDFSPGFHAISVNIDSINLEGGSYVAFFRLVSEQSDILVDSDNIMFDIERTYERYEHIGAIVAVKHSWSFTEDPIDNGKMSS
jgi:ABC-type polysaccharide/polyol phosphate transport system ATPase subunit